MPSTIKKDARIVVAMSGGVDSSVAAGWLKEQGYDVIGISLQLHDMAQKIDNKFGTCCSLSDISDARRVAEKLKIPFYVANMETEFNSAVIDDFVNEYLSGRTPNPCVKCNEKVKFSKLMDWAMDLGADYLATGHYANIQFNEDTSEYELLKGADVHKDQSYFLFTMKQKDLSKCLFPVGGFEKKQVRELARKLNLAVAEKPDSQEICFVQDRSYKDFIQQAVAPSLLTPGPIFNVEGQEIGAHQGIHNFTIGQRKGLQINTTEALFVLSIDKTRNAIVVGPEKHLFRTKCLVSKVNWVIAPNLELPQKYEAKIRYRAKESPVTVYPIPDNRLEVHFEEPQRAITPGQAIVFYKDDKVVGGGWIEQLPL
jgi:tRNA-specific 2-thiouridylase